MALAPGTRLGPYDVTAQIGVGGMGEVYRATDTNLARQVAIKVLPEAVAHDAERLARFDREARTLAALNHPNIAQIYGLERADGVTALVMELVEGPTLADLIASGHPDGERVSASRLHGEVGSARGGGTPRGLNLEVALPIAKQIADALEAAHEQGIIHRDLKPANVKVRDDGTVKVLDFGLAKAMAPAGAMSASASMSPTITTPAMTEMGMILGTAAYMAPEQAKGRAVDKRADIWAFGCVLYEMLTGRRAFAGEDVSDTLAAVLRAEVQFDALPPATPARVRQVLAACLRRDLKQRIPDIGAVRLALEGAFETTAPQAPAAVVAPPAWRRALPLVAVAVIASLLTALVAWIVRPASEPRTVGRFDYQLPAGQRFRGTGRPILALSPDGGAFVYNTSDGLYLRRMDELQARLIPGTEDVLSSPFFSPDGQSVGYFQGEHLKRQALSGGASVVIGPATNPLGVSWEADGTILFGQPEGILRVAADGGAPQVVVRAQPGERMYGPQLLPGGDSVLLTVATTSWDDGQVVVQSLRTGERTVVLRGRDARYLSSGHLVYALEDGLFAVAFDANRLATIGGPVSLVQGIDRAASATGAAFYAVSDTGTLVYVTLPADAGDRELVWVNRTGRVEAIGAVPGGAYTVPRLSPDGSRVLVATGQDIWMYSLADGRSTRLTPNGNAHGNGYMAWEPGGSRFGYTTVGGNAGEVWIGRTDASETPHALLDGQGKPVTLHVESWSPDGSVLAGHQHERGEDLYTLGPNDPTPQLRPFRVDEFGTAALVFSPDGRYVAYKSNESGDSEVYVRPFPGPGSQTTVSVGGGREPVWGKNGELFYRNLTGDRLMAVSVRTSPTLTLGRPAEVFSGSYFFAANPVPKYDVTANGQRFLMIRASGDAAVQADAAVRKIVVVQNWTEELKRLVPTN